jgi:non-heme chloroperoxidase
MTAQMRQVYEALFSSTAPSPPTYSHLTQAMATLIPIHSLWVEIVEIGPLAQAIRCAGKGHIVGRITVGMESADAITLHYEDHGAGAPVVLIHGYPASSRSWEKQAQALLSAGYRVITYDRRGFGASSQAIAGYDFDTLSHDLDIVMTQLDLRNVTLVGHCMGTGEAIRYLATVGSERVSKLVLLAPMPPFLLRTADNPEGVRQEVFDAIIKAMQARRPTYMKALLDDIYNVDVLGDSRVDSRVSEQDMQFSWNVAVNASAQAAVDSIVAWFTDFRQDLPRIDLPTLIGQGDQDRIFPIHVTGRRLSTLIKDAQFVVIKGGPHAIHWTHAEEVNRALLEFLGH